MLVFYAGHGKPTKWQTAGDSPAQNEVMLNQVLLGNGALRYLWQCSCNVMAHGKKLPGEAGKKDYYNPSTFWYSGDGYDDEDLRNAFWRWPDRIGSGLRMACGGTSAVCGHSQAVSERIWDNYNNKGYAVADSFLEGIFNAPSGVPLCLTRGGIDPASTPLYDSEFSTEPNSYDSAKGGPAYLHLLYPVRFGNESHPKAPTSSPPVGYYSVFFYRSGGFEHLCQSGEVSPKDRHCSAFSINPAEPYPEKIDVRSGARYVSGSSVGDPVLLTGSPQQWEEGRLLDLALEFFKRRGWSERHYRSPEGMRLVIETAQQGSYGQGFVRMQKSALVRLKRQIPNEREGGRIELVNVLGPGGEMSVLLNNVGTVVRAAKIWRPVAGEPGAVGKIERVEWVQARTDQQALTVLRQSPDWQNQAEAYQAQPAYYVWGYKEEAGNCRQKVMRLVYQFTFLPKDDDRYQDYAPLTLEIPAQALPEDESGLLPAEPCYPDTPQ